VTLFEIFIFFSVNNNLPYYADLWRNPSSLLRITLQIVDIWINMNKQSRQSHIMKIFLR